MNIFRGSVSSAAILATSPLGVAFFTGALRVGSVAPFFWVTLLWVTVFRLVTFGRPISFPLSPVQSLQEEGFLVHTRDPSSCSLFTPSGAAAARSAGSLRAGSTPP